MIQKELYCSLSQAIINLKPGSVFNTSENNYESIEWNSEGEPPTKEECETEIARLEAEWNSRQIEVGNQRFPEYPDLREQLDKLFHDIDEGKLDKTGTFYTAIKAVKDKYPKE